MEKAELTKLREYLRRSFGSAGINVQPHSRKEDAAEVTLGDAKLGDIIVDDEDGDRSFFFEMKVPVGRAALQGYLRKRFENDKLTTLSRMKKTDSVELNNGPEHIGILTVDDAQGESFTLEMSILDIDLEEN
jgi:Protein of unknown function (DUF3126)